MATSPYQYYNQILNAWPTAIALESQWFCYFDLQSVGVLQKDVSNILNTYESKSDWGINIETIATLINNDNQAKTENLIGCVFARQVTLPNETVDAGNQGLSYGGYQAPATTNGRQAYGKLKVIFTETNSSFIDFIIRPWIVAVGYYGLVSRSVNQVKCRYADMFYLAKTGPKSSSVIRKIARFYNIAPVSVSGLSNTYASEGLQFSSVDFVYDYYSIIDPTGGEYLNKTGGF